MFVTDDHWMESEPFHTWVVLATAEMCADNIEHKDKWDNINAILYEFAGLLYAMREESPSKPIDAASRAIVLFVAHMVSDHGLPAEDLERTFGAVGFLSKFCSIMLRHEIETQTRN